MQRGFRQKLVLIPGWATDYRVFGNLDLEYDYIIPLKFSPFNFQKSLLGLLERNSIEKISLFGWSLGGFLAANFCATYPKRVDELVLLSIRKKFAKNILQAIRQKLLQNKKAYLYRFYLDCFSLYDKQGLAWFKRHLLKSYLEEMHLNSLIRGLDYLSCAKLEPARLKEIKQIKILHGELDRIAPIAEARQISRSLTGAKFVALSGLGHNLFLNPCFREKFYAA